MDSANGDASVGGVAPFGYRWSDGSLIIDLTEAPIRRLIYELFIKHRRKKTVARILNELGHRTRRGAEFHDTTILRLLTDTAAKGTWLNGIVEHEVHPIVSAEIWERANAILNGGQLAKQPVQTFAGLVYCSCGAKMQVRENGINFICTDCRRKISTDDLEEIFVSQLGEHSAVRDVWDRLNPRDRRIVAEQICERLVVGQGTIDITFGLPVEELFEPVQRAGAEAAEPTKVRDDDLDEPLLTEGEAAEFLGVSKMTVNRNRRAGKIGFFKVGHRVLYSRRKHLVPFLSKEQTALIDEHSRGTPLTSAAGRLTRHQIMENMTGHNVTKDKTPCHE